MVRRKVPPRATAPLTPAAGWRTPTAAIGRPTPGDNRPVVFSFRYADHEHKGSWSWPTGADAARVLRFLCDVSQQTWHEVLTYRENGQLIHHEQAVDTVCDEAQQRFTELGHDVRAEVLFRFKLGYRERLWGFDLNGIFYVLWWDAKHKVYPLPDL